LLIVIYPLSLAFAKVLKEIDMLMVSGVNSLCMF
jgi:hypothetical protein